MGEKSNYPKSFVYGYIFLVRRVNSSTLKVENILFKKQSGEYLFKHNFQHRIDKPTSRFKAITT